MERFPQTEPRTLPKVVSIAIKHSAYIGFLVADFHHNLLKGGIYLYPPTQKAPQGKLRLMYECNALALLAEQAGGMASDGIQRVLKIEPQKLHQRVPFYIGSPNMVEDTLRHLSN